MKVSRIYSSIILVIATLSFSGCSTIPKHDDDREVQEARMAYENMWSLLGDEDLTDEDRNQAFKEAMESYHQRMMGLVESQEGDEALKVAIKEAMEYYHQHMMKLLASLGNSHNKGGTQHTQIRQALEDYQNMWQLLEAGQNSELNEQQQRVLKHFMEKYNKRHHKNAMGQYNKRHHDDSMKAYDREEDANYY